MLAEVIPLFPPGVHDLVSEPVEGATRLSCSEGDWLTVEAVTDAEIAWVRAAHVLHAVAHRGRCHAECVEEPECLYDGETS